MDSAHRNDSALHDLPPQLQLIIEHAIKDGVREAIEQIHKDKESPFYVPMKDHYDHHQYLAECIKCKDEKNANHAFVKKARAGMGIAGTTWLRVLITGICTGFASLFAFLLFEYFSKMK